MKDVESLCERAIVINHGRLVCDEGLDGLTQRFSTHKILKLQFADSAPPDLDEYGQLLETRGPVARLRVERQSVARVLADLLDRRQVEDVTVEEVPLEEVIAEVFRIGAETPAPAAVE
jgi:ABC-2 type transport system ATP-binding protein